MASNLKARLSRIEQVKREKPAYRDLLDFYEKIYREKEWCRQSLAAVCSEPEEEHIRLSTEQGFPMLDKNAIQFDVNVLEEFFHRLLLLSREKSPAAAADLALYLEQEEAGISSLIQGMWEGNLTLDAYGKKELSDPTLLFFLLVECIKPLYEQCVPALQEFFDPDCWKQGHCPACGESPPIAQISLQEGIKILFCTYCGMEWPFPLMKCPFCNHGEEDKKYLRVENEKQYRIEVCKSCEKYLKIVDAELIGPAVPMDIENIVTLHLDILAQQQGYRRGSSFPLLI